MNKNKNKIRKFSNGLLSRVSEVEKIAKQLYNACVEPDEVNGYVPGIYLAKAEQLFEILGGYDSTTLFLRQLQIVAPNVIMMLMTEFEEEAE